MTTPTIITKDQMIKLLLSAEPDFEPQWQAFAEEWELEEELPQYVALSILARHLIKKLEENDTATFDAVFDVVEQWHISGEHYVREAATVGLLEDLQNLNLHSSTKPSDFEQWLKPVSKRYWIKVQRFWSHGEVIADD